MQRLSYAVDPVFGCHLWTGKLDKDGYAVIYRGKSIQRAHRVAYEASRGAIAPGLELEHDCRRRRCINPEHLTPVTRSQNEQRKRWRSRVRLAKCRRGHDLKLHAMITEEGGRVCRLCTKEGACPKP